MAEGNGNGRLGGWLPFIVAGIPVVSALASLYLMTNTAYTKATALEEKVKILEAASQRHELQIRSLCSDDIEIETQFRSADQTRNIMHANDMRVQSMLWRRAFGADYPTDNSYYPTIAQERPQPCG